MSYSSYVRIGLMSYLLMFILPLYSQTSEATTPQSTATATATIESDKKNWYDKISLRGYVQVRYNRFLETNPLLKCEQCDKSIGESGGLSLRRMRLVFFGQLTQRIYFYFQPEFASSIGANNGNFGQIRDAYFDLGLDKKNEFRFRIGQSKIPYGFENLQSSQNRITFDRSDPTNTASANERDLGFIFYYAPESKRKLFAALVRDGLKGSGDYGIFGFGLYNGQTANKPEANNTPHLVTRFSYPFVYKNQIVEAGIQAYKGIWTMTSDNYSVGTKLVNDLSYKDERVGATFVLYPKPFGIQAEYNVGRGPEFNPSTDSIEVQNLKGGYVTLSLLLTLKGKTLIPFSRYQYYDGGKKYELDARSYTVKEIETGAEFHFNKNLELAVAYVLSDRRFEDFKLQSNKQKGNFLRIQMQMNF